MDGDEDVYLPVTELGRYLENKNIFGHFDVMSSSLAEYQIEAKSQFGFICGQNIPDIYEYIFSAIISKFLPGAKYLNEIVSCIHLWFSEKKGALMMLGMEVWGIILKRMKLLQAWQSSSRFYTKADVIGFKFSLEYRMLKETTLLKECSTKISAALLELDRLVVKLQSVKRGDPNYNNKCNDIILEIVSIRHSINVLVERIGNLLLSQANSIRRFSRRTGEIQEKKEPDEPILEDELEDLLPVGEGQSTDITMRDKSIFENEVPDILEDNFFMSRDEVFELKASEEPVDDSAFNSSSPSDEMTKEMRTIQAELMTQLRGSLSTRRADMQAREAQAYLQLYGKLPEESEEGLLPKPSLPFSNSESSVPTELHQSCPEPSIAGDIDINSPDTFGDEIDPFEDLEIKSEFLSSLQELLRKRGGCC